MPLTTPGMVDAAHAAGLEVITWTVHDVPTMDALLDAGVDGLITDHPDRLRWLLERRAVPVPDPSPGAAG